MNNRQIVVQNDVEQQSQIKFNNQYIHSNNNDYIDTYIKLQNFNARVPSQELEQLGVLVAWDSNVSNVVIAQEATELIKLFKLDDLQMITVAEKFTYLINPHQDSELRIIAPLANYGTILRNYYERKFEASQQQKVVRNYNQQVETAHKEIRHTHNNSPSLINLQTLHYEEKRVMDMAAYNEGYNFHKCSPIMSSNAYGNISYRTDNIPTDIQELRIQITSDQQQAFQNRPCSGFFKDYCSSFTTEFARAMVAPTYGEQVEHKRTLSYLFETRPIRRHEPLLKASEYLQQWDVSQLDVAQAVQPVVTTLHNRNPQRTENANYNTQLTELIAPQLIDELQGLEYELYHHEHTWWTQLDSHLTEHQNNIAQHPVGVAIEHNNNLALAINDQERIVTKIEHEKHALLARNPFNKLNEAYTQLRNNASDTTIKNATLSVNELFLWKKELLVAELQLRKAYDNLAYLRQCRQINIKRIDKYYRKLNVATGIATLVGSSAYNVYQEGKQAQDRQQTAIQTFHESQQRHTTLLHVHEQNFARVAGTMLDIKARLESNAVDVPSTIAQERIKAIDQTLENNGRQVESHRSITSMFSSSELFILEQRGINLSNLENTLGTNFEHQLTHEQCNLIKEALKFNALDPKLSHELGIFDNIMKEAIEHRGDIQVQARYTDKAYAILNNIKDIAAGVCEHIGTEVKDVVTNLPATAIISGAAQVAVTGLTTVNPLLGMAAEGGLVAVNVYNNSTALKKNFSALFESIKQGNLKEAGSFSAASASNIFALALVGQKVIKLGQPEVLKNSFIKDRMNKGRIINTAEEQIKFIKEVQKEGYEHLKQYNAYKFTAEKGNSFQPIKPGAIYLSKDRLHYEIELFDKRGNHLGSIDPVSREWLKPAVNGRNLFEQAKK